MKWVFLMAACAWVGGGLIAAPQFYLNEVEVTSTSALGSVAYNQSVSIRVTFEADAVSDGTLFEVKGGGGNASVTEVYKRLAITLEEGALQGIVAGKNGTDVLLGGAALLDTLPEGTVRAVMVIETTTGTSVAPRALAVGGSVQAGSNFNFDNLAGSAWSANAPFDTWSVSDAITSLEVFTDVAWTTTEMEEYVTPPAEPEVILEVEGDVTWPEEAPDKVCFKGGTLVIPQGTTINTLRLTEDSGEGSLVVYGCIEGIDSGEPLMTALELPTNLTLTLAEGALFLMDGRLSAPVEVTGLVTLGAASEQGTLTLDTVTVTETGALSVVRGCLEVYECPKVTVQEGAALRRWVAPGFAFKVSYQQ